MEQTQEQIWHCPSEPDRELAELLVRTFTAPVWSDLAYHFKLGYPYTLADKFDLVYRLLGCKK